MDEHATPRPQAATVYLLRSRACPAEPYVGVTRGSLRDRLRRHNEGDVPSTARYRPWRIVAAFWFPNEQTAFAFERYLKSGSGRAFAKRHFRDQGPARPPERRAAAPTRAPYHGDPHRP